MEPHSRMYVVSAGSAVDERCQLTCHDGGDSRAVSGGGRRWQTLGLKMKLFVFTTIELLVATEVFLTAPGTTKAGHTPTLKQNKQFTTIRRPADA